MLDHVAEGQRLPVGEPVPEGQYIATDRKFSVGLDFVELGGEACGEELEPAGQVHARFADGLKRPVEGCAVSIVVLTDREEPFKVVSSAVEVEGREQPRSTAVAIEEGMDVDELEQRDRPGAAQLARV